MNEQIDKKQLQLKTSGGLLYKAKNIVVSFTVCSLFLGTGCLQNMVSSGFLPSHNFSSKEIASESDGIVALKEVFDSSVEKIPTFPGPDFTIISFSPILNSRLSLFLRVTLCFFMVESRMFYISIF